MSQGFYQSPPATPGTTMSGRWVVDEGPSDDSPEVRVLKAFQTMCDEHGGPRQYLNTIFCDANSQARFLDYINRYFPPLSSVNYHNRRELTKHIVHEGDTSSFQSPMALHPSLFSWHPDSSVKDTWEGAQC